MEQETYECQICGGTLGEEKELCDRCLDEVLEAEEGDRKLTAMQEEE